MVVVPEATNLGVENSVAFGKEMDELLAQKHQRIVFDFRKLEFISSAGLRPLIKTCIALKSGGQVAIVSPPKSPVRKILDLANFRLMASIHDSMDFLVS